MRVENARPFTNLLSGSPIGSLLLPATPVDFFLCGSRCVLPELPASAPTPTWLCSRRFAESGRIGALSQSFLLADALRLRSATLNPETCPKNQHLTSDRMALHGIAESPRATRCASPANLLVSSRVAGITRRKVSSEPLEKWRTATCFSLQIISRVSSPQPAAHPAKQVLLASHSPFNDRAQLARCRPRWWWSSPGSPSNLSGTDEGEPICSSGTATTRVRKRSVKRRDDIVRAGTTRSPLRRFLVIRF
jgi:hypothetical protein